MPVASTPPKSALVSYTHTNPDWEDDPELEHQRQDDVVRFVTALRDNGIDADADVFQQGVDWTRWGPGRVEESDYTLVVVSQGWLQAWRGDGDPAQFRGAGAEANVLRGFLVKNRDELRRRCRLILLPGATHDDIPVDMHGVPRYRFAGRFDLAELDPLLRDLTDQPRYVLAPVGQVPVLPPLDATKLDARSTAPAVAESVSKVDDQRREQESRLRRLRSQLGVLPPERLGEGPHLPWIRARMQLISEISKLEAQLGQDPDEEQ